LSFPDKVYTGKEVKAAKALVDQGYKHKLMVEGKPDFTRKVKEALEYIETAGYIDYLQTFIRSIIEIDGMTQLRQTEVSIWANKFAVDNPVDAASLFIQKAYSMQEYLNGKLYYGGAAEKRSINKRIEFLQVLKEKTSDRSVKEECERLLGLWNDSSL
jgi:ribosomal protein S7